MREHKINYVTIVSGLPRSGTSVAMQMIVAGGRPALTDGIRKANESNPKGYFEYEKVKRLKSDNGWLNEARGHVVKIIAQLLTSLPGDIECRVVYVERELDEVLASQSRMLTLDGLKGASISDDRLRSVFEVQAHRVHEWLGKQERVATLVINHRIILINPQQAARQINEFLGGELDEKAMQAVVDPTLYRNRFT